jgi:hypothetical protein
LPQIVCLSELAAEPGRSLGGSRGCHSRWSLLHVAVGAGLELRRDLEPALRRLRGGSASLDSLRGNRPLSAADPQVGGGSALRVVVSRSARWCSQVIGGGEGGASGISDIGRVASTMASMPRRTSADRVGHACTRVRRPAPSCEPERRVERRVEDGDFRKMVSPIGFEPTTCGSGKRSGQVISCKIPEKLNAALPCLAHAGRRAHAGLPRGGRQVSMMRKIRTFKGSSACPSHHAAAGDKGRTRGSTSGFTAKDGARAMSSRRTSLALW